METRARVVKGKIIPMAGRDGGCGISFYWIRKVINVRDSHFLPPVIIPAVILLEGFLCNNCSCSIKYNWFFSVSGCVWRGHNAIICQYDINKRFGPVRVKRKQQSHNSYKFYFYSFLRIFMFFSSEFQLYFSADNCVYWYFLIKLTCLIV